MPRGCSGLTFLPSLFSYLPLYGKNDAQDPGVCSSIAHVDLRALMKLIARSLICPVHLEPLVRPAEEVLSH